MQYSGEPRVLNSTWRLKMKCVSFHHSLIAKTLPDGQTSQSQLAMQHATVLIMANTLMSHENVHDSRSLKTRILADWADSQ